jgi:uncharacterized membrane protein (UPF0127 family)
MHLLCEAPEGPFRQKVPVPFSREELLMRLVSETTGKIVVAELRIADGFWSRLAGLQFRRELPPDAGLLLVPCNSVHTCFVRFPVDVVFLDDRGCVLAVRRDLRPWRIAFGPRKTHAVLEVTAGTAAVQHGETLRLETSDEIMAAPPTSVAFLRR